MIIYFIFAFCERRVNFNLPFRFNRVNSNEGTSVKRFAQYGRMMKRKMEMARYLKMLKSLFQVKFTQLQDDEGFFRGSVSRN